MKILLHFLLVLSLALPISMTGQNLAKQIPIPRTNSEFFRDSIERMVWADAKKKTGSLKLRMFEFDNNIWLWSGRDSTETRAARKSIQSYMAATRAKINKDRRVSAGNQANQTIPILVNEASPYDTVINLYTFNKTSKAMAKSGSSKSAASKAPAKKSAAPKKASTKSTSSKSSKGKGEVTVSKDLQRGHLERRGVPLETDVAVSNADGNPSSVDPQMYGGDQATPFADRP